VDLINSLIYLSISHLLFLQFNDLSQLLPFCDKPSSLGYVCKTGSRPTSQYVSNYYFSFQSVSGKWQEHANITWSPKILIVMLILYYCAARWFSLCLGQSLVSNLKCLISDKIPIISVSKINVSGLISVSA